MKNILVIADPYDQKQTAFEKALVIGKNTIASIHLLVFCHDSFGQVDAERKESLKTMVMERYQQWWENYLANHIVNMSVSYEVIWAKHIHQIILENCKKRPYDLLIKTGHRSESLLHTPTDWHLFRKAHIPIYSVNEANTQDKNEIVLVALDLLTYQEEKQALNRKLLEAGFQLAMQSNAQLHCCYAIMVSAMLEEVGVVDLNEEIRRLEEVARSKAADLLDTYEIDANHLHIEEGQASKVVINLAQKLKAGCTVVGSMGRKGISGKIIGNTAEEIIQGLTCDLMVVSGDG